MGHLRALGLRVQQHRVTKSLVRVDPETSRLRCGVLVKRRKYNVPGPNSLWHLDGNHSLNSLSFVIHGCIYGYSRLVTYLQCCLNNRKETVDELFEHAIYEFGAPSRIRTDKGGENVLTWERMETIIQVF